MDDNGITKTAHIEFRGRLSIPLGEDAAGIVAFDADVSTSFVVHIQKTIPKSIVDCNTLDLIKYLSVETQLTLRLVFERVPLYHILG